MLLTSKEYTKPFASLYESKRNTSLINNSAPYTKAFAFVMLMQRFFLPTLSSMSPVILLAVLYWEQCSARHAIVI